MNWKYQLRDILSAALITLSFLAEIAVLPRFIPLSFLQIGLLWGVTAYSILVLSSWLFGKNKQKKKLATGLTLTAIGIGSGFILFIVGNFSINKYADRSGQGRTGTAIRLGA